MKINIAELRRKCESRTAILLDSVDVKKMCDIAEAAKFVVKEIVEKLDGDLGSVSGAEAVLITEVADVEIGDE